MATRIQRLAEALAGELVERRIVDEIVIHNAHPVAQIGALTATARRFRTHPGLFVDGLRYSTEYRGRGKLSSGKRGSEAAVWGHYYPYRPIPEISMNLGTFGSSQQRCDARLGLRFLHLTAIDFVNHELGHRALLKILETTRGRRSIRALFKGCFDWTPDLSDCTGKIELPKAVKAKVDKTLDLWDEDGVDDLDEAFAYGYETACLGSKSKFCRIILECVDEHFGSRQYERVAVPAVAHLARSFGVELAPLSH